MTLGEFRELTKDAPDTAHVGVIFKENPFYNEVWAGIAAREGRLDLEPKYNCFVSVNDVMIQVS